MRSLLPLLPSLLFLLLCLLGAAPQATTGKATEGSESDDFAKFGATGPVAPQGFYTTTEDGVSDEPPVVVDMLGDTPVYRRELISPVYTMDTVYRSMMGPQSWYLFQLGRGLPDEQPKGNELLWMTGYEAQMVAPDGDAAMSREFMCHSNLDVNGELFHGRFPSRLRLRSDRLFTLAQGQLYVKLPEGFGVPVMGGYPLRMGTQALNHNVVDREVEVRTKITVDFVRDRDLAKPLKPLIPRGVSALVLVEGPDGHYGIDPIEVDPAKHGPGCLIGEGISGTLAKDDQGRTFAGFWVVPPGRQVNHTRITPMLDLPYDTTVHYITVHLHPYAESLELYDLTADRTVYKSKARNVEKGIGLAEVQYLSSEEGIELFANHEYELITTYNNTTGVDQDSMATMFFYLLAKDLYDFDFRPREAGTVPSAGKPRS